MHSERNAIPALPPEAVIFTPQLVYRPCRMPNLSEETNAFHELAMCLVSNPDRILDRLVEVALEICDGDTVGISLEATDAHGAQIFRWAAMAGELKELAGRTTPRNFSPCGICVDQNQPLLMKDLARAYPYLENAPRPFVEALLLPWGTRGGPVGTLWIVSHDDRRMFDLHDVRVLSGLAAFAYGAICLKQNAQKAERVSTAVCLTSTMAHQVNNPLQAAMLLLFRLRGESEHSAQGTEILNALAGEIERIAEQSSECLRSQRVVGGEKQQPASDKRTGSRLAGDEQLQTHPALKKA